MNDMKDVDDMNDDMYDMDDEMNDEMFANLDPSLKASVEVPDFNGYKSGFVAGRQTKRWKINAYERANRNANRNRVFSPRNNAQGDSRNLNNSKRANGVSRYARNPQAAHFARPAFERYCRRVACRC